MSLCVVAGGKLTMLAFSAFTLGWTHSVEKTLWQEDWLVTPAGLELVQARVKGSGAGMEPPDHAILQDGWWVYTPTLPVLPRLALAASGASVSGWTICSGDECAEFGKEAGDTLILEPCIK